MAFTPPALDTAEKESAGFTPPPVSAEEFTPPPVDTAEPTRTAAEMLAPTRQSYPGNVSTTEGGPPLSMAPASIDAEDVRDVYHDVSRPGIPIPKFKINPDDSKRAAVGKEAVNLLTSIPEFMESPLGIATMGAGTVFPRVVAGLFGADSAKNVGEQVLRTHKEWDQYTPAQKAAAVTDIVGGVALTAVMAKGAARKAPVQTPELAAVDAAARQEVTRNAAVEAAAQMPERPETIGAQLDWLKGGQRKAVLLTPGAEMPALPEGTDIHPTDAGTFIYSPERTSPAEIDRAVAENKIGDLLDYGIADKPAPGQALGVVTIRDANGMEKQAVVTDHANLQTVMDKAKALAGPKDTVQMETPEQVLQGRQAPEAGPVETPTMRMAREQREAMARLRAQPAQETILPPPTDQPESIQTQPDANGIVKGRPKTREDMEMDRLRALPEGPEGEAILNRQEIERAINSINVENLDPAQAAFDLVSLVRKADRDPSLRPALTKAFSKVGGAAKRQGISQEKLNVAIAAEMRLTYGDDAPEMAQHYFGSGVSKTALKPVEITKADYDAARKGNSPFMEVSTATGLAKDIKRAEEFGQDALTERPGETEPRPVQQLFVGDQFQVKGQPVHVAEWVTDAETGQPAGVNVDGAYGRQFIPADQTVHIDANSLTDPVSNWLDKAIAATAPEHGVVMEGVTGAPVWMSKAAINGALKLAKFAYTKTRDISRSVGEAMRFLRAQKLDGFNEAEAMDWLESNLRGDPALQDTGRAIGAATEERRPLPNTSAAQIMSGSNTTTLPFQEDLQAAVTGMGWRQRTGAWLGGAVAETFPVATRLWRELGEQGARWISSRMAALPLADAFSGDTTRGLNLDDVEFGAALHEDNLRSVKKSQLDNAVQLDQAGDAAGAAKLRAQAQKVFSFVGQGGVFADEASYQKYLQSPIVQAALQRHVAAWTRLVDPMYREAMKLDPNVQLPERGLQTGARINLNFVREGEAAGLNVFVGSAAPKGVLSNVLQRRSPFGRMAKGTAQAYRPSYQDAMRNTFARQLEIANRNKFDRMMVESGNAIIDRPGRQNDIKIAGEGVTPFEIKRTTIQADGRRIPAFENIYVRNSLAPEYRSALNLDPKFYVPIVTPVAKLVNGLALSGLTEISAHIGNLSHALFWRPGVTQSFWSEIGLSALGRADAFVSVVKAMRKFTAEDQVRIRELSEIGAMREPPPPKSGFNPTKWGGKVIEHMDTRTRLQLDRMYQNLAEQDLVPKTETARREFVNQVGQYNRRAQGQVMHWLRDTGIAPFVTAGRSFNVLALRTALLHPGVEATGAGSRLAMAATMASKVGGTLALISTLNYLLTHNKGGGVFGRPGVPFGAVDLGVDDKNKRPLTLNLANILGLQRVARVTGMRGGAEALRMHLKLGDVLDSTYRDLQNAWTAPILGPVARTVSLATTGNQPAKGVPRTAPVVPPGQSQTLENMKTAAIETSPIVAGIHDSLEPGATGWEWLQRQAGRFTLQPGKPQQLSDPQQYAKHVDRAQAANFIDDVIMRARKLQGVDRAKYVKDSIMQLDPSDRLHALDTLEERRIIPPGSVPRFR